jgi:hypothetical protein
MSYLKAASMFTFQYWSAKRLALLIGFVLTISGSLGSQFYVGRLQRSAGVLDEQARDTAAKIDTLKNSQAQYLQFRQQTALVFALNAAGFDSSDEAKRTHIGNLYQLSLLDRSNAMRAMMGELALERVINYTTTRDEYAVLIAEARKSFSLGAYTALDDFERSTMDRANTLMSTLQQRYLLLVQSKSATNRDLDQRQSTLLALTVLGSTFLLAANLISTRQPQPDQAPAKGVPTVTEDDRVAELTTAAQLIEFALDRARAENLKTQIETPIGDT